MTQYDIWYMKPAFFSTFIFGHQKPKLRDLNNTHVLLRTDLDQSNMEEVFRYMQGEVWSPNGEAQELILSKGLQHTSMSVGDVLRDRNTNEFYVVANFGFDKLK